MKTRFLLISALLVSALMGCSKESNEMYDDSVADNKGSFSLFVNGVDTKTTYHYDDVNFKHQTLWAAGDEINVFHESTASLGNYVSDKIFTTSTASEPGSPATFTGTVTGELTGTYNWYAFYPYSKYITTPANTSSGYVTLGSAATGAQTQTGNSNMSHIAGPNYPVAGKTTTSVSAGTKPSISMKHLSTLLEVVVTNSTNDPITVTSLSLKTLNSDDTDGEDIVGTYYINFVDMSNVVYTGSGASYVSNTATLNVTGGTAIDKGKTAKFYLAIKPHTEAIGKKLSMTVNTTTSNQTITESLTTPLTFTAGKIKTLNFNYTKEASGDITVAWLPTNGSLGSQISTVGGTATGTIKTTAGLISWDWSYTRTLLSVADGKKDYVGFTSPNIQLGSGNALEQIVFTTSNIPGTIKTIKVTCRGDKHKISATVGGNTYISETNMTNDHVEYKNAVAGSSSGTINISILPQGTDRKAFYIQKLEVVYTP